MRAGMPAARASAVRSTACSLQSPRSTRSTSRALGTVALGSFVMPAVAALLLLLACVLAVLGCRRLLRVFALDHGDAHVGQHRHGVLDLVGRHLLGGQHGIEGVEGHEPARL